jgi:type IV pilus assembly protein PilE
MSRQRGFTLIELLIVMVVVAILTALAVSGYQSSIRKSRRSEAYNLIGQLQLSLERWRAENPCYGTSAAGTCSTFTASGTYPDTSAAPYGGTNGPTYYSITLSGASPTSYTITAQPKSGTSQAKDTCGNLVATGNAKPVWSIPSSNCN